MLKPKRHLTDEERQRRGDLMREIGARHRARVAAAEEAKDRRKDWRTAERIAETLVRAGEEWIAPPPFHDLPINAGPRQGFVVPTAEK